ncbi:hypothetical protein ZWY2020_041497 [Hordeum vulgare]|nr:hypothetical protein ZWY2020_041497 [Hordeum vulgare]
MGHEIFFGALSFIVDDSAWLRDAPLDAEALPAGYASRPAAFFFSAAGSVDLHRRYAAATSVPPSAPTLGNTPSATSRWSSQVAVLESVVVAPPSQRSGSVPTEFPSETFEGTCKRPAGLVELQHCVQKQNEPLRDFIQRWTTLYHTVENVTEHQVVCAFKAARRTGSQTKFGRTGDISMSKMMEITTRYANGEEEDRIRSGKHKTVADGDGGNTRKQKQKAPSTPQAETTAVTNAKFKGKGKAQFTP